MGAANTYNDIEMAWLMKLRTVVARLGEMDCERWWNSDGQLGPQGASVLRRGLPRTHHFAQARSVWTIAGLRCAQIFDPPGAVTLWRLTDALEERLDVLWEGWLDDAASWRPFFERVARLKHTDVPTALKDFDLVTDDEIASGAKIKRASDGRSIMVPGVFDERRRSVALLALSFAAGSQGNLVVPHARRAGA
ncbi:BrxE family protein [Bradyrhizobium sp. RDI18]|uniref:BrxE family protein n=1 Tax=Bradyrhizobium sp. RDI18 TaxID=3367400 RepID=UPI0037213B49